VPDRVADVALPVPVNQMFPFESATSPCGRSLDLQRNSGTSRLGSTRPSCLIVREPQRAVRPDGDHADRAFRPQNIHRESSLSVRRIPPGSFATQAHSVQADHTPNHPFFILISTSRNESFSPLCRSYLFLCPGERTPALLASSSLFHLIIYSHERRRTMQYELPSFGRGSISIAAPKY